MLFRILLSGTVHKRTLGLKPKVVCCLASFKICNLVFASCSWSVRSFQQLYSSPLYNQPFVEKTCTFVVALLESCWSWTDHHDMICKILSMFMFPTESSLFLMPVISVHCCFFWFSLEMRNCCRGSRRKVGGRTREGHRTRDLGKQLALHALAREHKTVLCFGSGACTNKMLALFSGSFVFLLHHETTRQPQHRMDCMREVGKQTCA